MYSVPAFGPGRPSTRSHCGAENIGAPFVDPTIVVLLITTRALGNVGSNSTSEPSKIKKLPRCLELGLHITNTGSPSANRELRLVPLLLGGFQGRR